MILGKPIRRLYTAQADKLLQCTLENQVYQLKLNNPTKKNALSKLLLDQLDEALDQIDNDNDARAVTVSSTTPGFFCTGADLKAR